MPPRKRSRVSRKGGRRYGAAAGAASARFRAVVRTEVKKMAESKSITSQTALVTTYSTSNVVCLNQCALGVFRNQRLASHANWLRMKLNFVMAAGSVGGAGLIGQPARIRLLCVVDKATTGGASGVGVAPLISNLVIDPTAANQYYSMLNPSTVPSRFTVLFDKLITLNVGGGATDQALDGIWRVNKKLNVHTTYVDASNTGTVTDIQKNGIFLFSVSDQTGLNVPSAAMEYSMEWVDEA